MSPNDLFRFLLALVLLPPLIHLGRQLRLPERTWRSFLIGVLLIIGAFGLAAFEGPGNEFRLARHLFFAGGAFTLAFAAWQVRRRELAAGGGRR